MDPQAIGRTSATFTMDVERGKIREFARATGSRDPAYLDSERPVIPPTFLTTQAFWQDEEADPWKMAGLDLSRSLHAEQEYVFFGPPPCAGARLTFRTTITDGYATRRRRGGEMTFVVARTQFWDESGRLVAEARSVGVEVDSPSTETS